LRALACLKKSYECEVPDDGHPLQSVGTERRISSNSSFFCPGQRSLASSASALEVRGHTTAEATACVRQYFLEVRRAHIYFTYLTSIREACPGCGHRPRRNGSAGNPFPLRTPMCDGRELAAVAKARCIDLGDSDRAEDHAVGGGTLVQRPARFLIGADFHGHPVTEAHLAVGRWQS
jgi:hypothetical protein